MKHNSISAFLMWIAGRCSAVGAIGLGAVCLAFAAVLLIGSGEAAVALGAVTFMPPPAWRRAAPFLGEEARFAGCRGPAALTDADGVLLSVNRAMRAASGAIAEASLADRLATWIRDPAPVIYQLCRAARANPVVSYAGPDSSGAAHRVVVENAGNGTLLWQVEAAVEINRELATAFDDAPFGHCRLGPDGAISAVNRTLQSWLGLVPRNEADLFTGDGDDTALRRLAGDPVRQVQVMRAQREDGLSDLFLIPTVAPTRGATLPQTLMDDLPVAIVQIDVDGRIGALNRASVQLLGPLVRTGMAFDGVLEGIGTSLPDRLERAMESAPGARTELALRPVGGRDQFLQCSLVRVEIDEAPALLAVLLDATELKALEQQFVQSQKMQAVGQLAGGVAHDFNNLLTAIAGHCDLLLMRHDEGDGDHGDLMQIRQNANRATALVRQLLAFSRKQTLRPTIVDLRTVLAELAHLLDRLLGERVRLRIRHGSDVPAVLVDAPQLEQVIMNLVVNARDAMRDGGEVEIRTSAVRLESELRRDRARVPPGDYALIRVSDTGVGIAPDRLNKIFEPFFTTKRVGEGTGLGLSTAYGIVKQTGGFIFADSELGQGTTFSIYLPKQVGAVAPAPAKLTGPSNKADAEMPDLTGRGVVLLVEDEAPVRSFAARALRLRGYEVMEAEDAEQALELLAEPETRIDMLLTDVVMPGLDGPSLVRQARADRPDLRVLFVSGYAEDVIQNNPIDIPNASFLAKPFSLSDLSRRVKEMLDE
ncbi:MAG: ATP-binding protein [Pseudomonadota bacterium]